MAGLQARGETLWPLMEEDTYIPDDLKLILRATKFDNLYALSRFDMVKDIDSIESFMQNTLHTLIPPSEYEEYYDIFKGQPKNFVLVGGHRVALKLLVERSKAIIASNKKRFNSDVDNGSSDNNNSTSSSKRSKESKTSTSDDICKAKVTLQNSLKSYIKDHYPSLQETEIICSVGKDGFGSLVAQANCCVPDCKEVRKISRNETRWNTTNYYTHVRTHFATGRTTNKKSGKKFKRIDSMFEHIGGKSRNTKSVAPSNSSDVEDEPEEVDLSGKGASEEESDTNQNSDDSFSPSSRSKSKNGHKSQGRSILDSDGEEENHLLTETPTDNQEMQDSRSDPKDAHNNENSSSKKSF